MAHTYTWDKLARNQRRLRNYTPQPVPRFELLGVVPFVGTKSCLIKLQAWGVTQKKLHQISMLFSDCEIQTGEHEELSLWDYFKVDYKNQVYYIPKFSSRKNPLTLRCSCADFFFSWAWWCQKAGCLYGPIPRSYVRRTKDRPERNPLHIPGTCKHTYHAWEFIKRQGFTLD